MTPTKISLNYFYKYIFFKALQAENKDFWQNEYIDIHPKYILCKHNINHQWQSCLEISFCKFEALMLKT